METVLLVVHVIISLALIGMVLIQRSESDGMGLAGGGGGANFMTGRTAANFLTRTTAVLATLFILNSLALGIIAANKKPDSITDTIKSISSEQTEADAESAEGKDAKSGDEKADKKPTEKPASKQSTEPSVPTE